ncbi:MAG: Protein translocase subunit YajC [Thermodesulfobacterium sp.]|uniref:Sec translocon accessory complex subunit YajC n=1 Tax=Candidatus Thermodesulfobacterium syntrophicum TaxID=3060442 RepID=A0AAE3TFL9_9BACT|nr:Protein translocase subunit YajC [Candidatus Thermodesulfobacterium syntrophicum]
MDWFNFLVTSAFAMGTPPQQGQASQGGGLIGFLFTLLPLILIFVIFYLLLIRPQQKKMKEHQKFLSELRIGQKVFTAGGVVGKVVKIEDNIVWLEVDKNLNIPVIKGYISGPFTQ